MATFTSNASIPSAFSSFPHLQANITEHSNEYYYYAINKTQFRLYVTTFIENRIMDQEYLTKITVWLVRIMLAVGMYGGLIDFITRNNLGALRINMRIFVIEVQWYVNPVVLTIAIAVAFGLWIDKLAVLLGYQPVP